MIRQDGNRVFYVPGFTTTPSSEHLESLKARFLPSGNPINHPLFLMEQDIFDSIIQYLTPKSILLSLITSRCWLSNVVRCLRKAFVTRSWPWLETDNSFGMLAYDYGEGGYNTYRSLLAPSNAGHRFLEFSCGKNGDGSEFCGCEQKSFEETLKRVVELKMDSHLQEWYTALLFAARDTGPINMSIIDSNDSLTAEECGGDFTLRACVIVIPFKKKSRYKSLFSQ